LKSTMTSPKSDFNKSRCLVSAIVLKPRRKFCRGRGERQGSGEHELRVCVLY
jgi:hypothetical protein